MGKIIFGIQGVVAARPIEPAFLWWTVKNTDALLQVHSVVFRGHSGAILRFLRSQVHFLARPISFLRKVLFVRTGAKK